MPVQIICTFDLIKTKKAMLLTRSNMVFHGTRGQETPKSIVLSGRNSNSSGILLLSWLPASSEMIRSNVKALTPVQQFVHYNSMGKCFVAQWRITPKLMV